MVVSTRSTQTLETLATSSLCHCVKAHPTDQLVLMAHGLELHGSCCIVGSETAARQLRWKREKGSGKWPCSPTVGQAPGDALGSLKGTPAVLRVLSHLSVAGAVEPGWCGGMACCGPSVIVLSAPWP